MTKILSREDAKQQLALMRIASLDDVSKLALVYQIHSFSDVETVHATLADQGMKPLSDELAATLIGDPPQPPVHPDVLPVIEECARFKLLYATNHFLATELAKHSIEATVVGEVEDAGLCPCCLHLSIAPGEEGAWNICGVCFWENGGDGPNHMSLAEARANFASLGAVSEPMLQFVDEDGPRKYARASAAPGQEKTFMRQTLQDIHNWTWCVLDDGGSMEKELRRELSAKHPLHGIKVEALASDMDDVLFRGEDGRYAFVHLTWHKETDPSCPFTVFYETWFDVVERLLLPDQ